MASLERGESEIGFLYFAFELRETLLNPCNRLFRACYVVGGLRGALSIVGCFCLG